MIEEQGFDIVFNPSGDEVYQFSALAYELTALSIFRSPETMRRELEQCDPGPYRGQPRALGLLHRKDQATV